MSGPSGGGRASVQIPRDVIMIDSDAPNNNNTSSESETQPDAPTPARNIPPPEVTIAQLAGRGGLVISGSTVGILA